MAGFPRPERLESSFFTAWCWGFISECSGGNHGHSKLSLAPAVVGFVVGYNPSVIAFLQFAMHFLTVLFFIGLAGSSIVVILSFIEDLGELLGED